MRLNGTSKVTDTDTDRQTYGHFDLQKASAQKADALRKKKRSYRPKGHFIEKSASTHIT